MELPKRKRMRLSQYDYSTPGSYFITVCTVKKQPLLWDDCDNLSDIGEVVQQGILQIPNRYESVMVDVFCVMPDHIHLIVSIHSDEDGRQVAAPTISQVISSLKRWVSCKVGFSVWQKSFYDHKIRNAVDYTETWRYIESNPLKYKLKQAP